MRRVHKYPVPRRTKKFSLILPQGFKFLRVAFQDENLQMWVEISDHAKSDTTIFHVFGTGHDIPPGLEYVTSYDDGPFVFHIYKQNP